ncbi:TPA: fimbria/pilus outer membrane usher protein [Klebsiella aerogenes]|nr:fimbria/pilus outer membrane usher protein [Klebsiella aerogenes]
MMTILVPGQGLAGRWEFDVSQLGADIGGDEATQLNEGGQLPGVYRVDILLNGDFMETQDIRFRRADNARDDTGLQPCLTLKQLSAYGVRIEDWPGLMAHENDECVDLSVIPDARATFSFAQQQLLLSVPQADLRIQSHDLAPEALWDDGMAAILLNYQASATRTEQRQHSGTDSRSQYVMLSPGANLGAWRLRSSSTWQKNSGGPGRWQTAYTWLERGFYGLRSRLTLGDRSTSSVVFDSIPFRGAMLGTDSSMVPSSERSFTPVVRGIARTMARVEVRQNGFTIYEDTVAPGAFALDNLPVTSSGGDLQVTVRETDGSTQHFTVAWQTPAIAVREGYLDWSLMAGKYHASGGGGAAAPVAQGTLIYGLPWDLTAYGGMQGASHYQAMTAGVGVSLGELGSLSVDATRADGQWHDGTREVGTAWRLRYSKTLATTGTSVVLASYQYPSAGYNTMADILSSYGHTGHNSVPVFPGDSAADVRPDKRQSRSTLSLNQPFGNYGYLNLSFNQDKYRQRGTTESLAASYGFSFRDVSVSLNWSRNRWRQGGQRSQDNTISLMLSMPLGGLPGSDGSVNWQMTHPSSGGDTQQVGMSGQAWDRRLYWNASQRHQSSAPQGTDSNNSTLMAGWRGRDGEVSGNYGYSPSVRQSGISLNGGAVLTGEGLTLGQQLGDTVALVKAPGASNVPVGGWPGVSTDYRGYTTQSYLRPYQKNTISLDPTRLPADADITQTDVTVTPTAGAVIPATFTTHTGSRALITLRRPTGQSVQFGAMVTLKNNAEGSTGIVDENSTVYLSGLTPVGELLVRWGLKPEQRCEAHYALPESSDSSGIFTTQATCIAGDNEKEVEHE